MTLISEIERLKQLSTSKRVFKLALSGEAQAQFERGYLLFLEPETKTHGIEWLRLAAAQSHPAALEVLASVDCNDFK